MDISYSYWISGSLTLVVGVLLLSIRYDEPLNQRSYNIIRRYLAYGALIDFIIDVLSILCIYQNISTITLNALIVPLLFYAQLRLMSHAMLAMLHNDKVSEHRLSYLVVPPALFVSVNLIVYLAWSDWGNILSWQNYEAFLETIFSTIFTSIFYAYIIILMLFKCYKLWKNSRLFILKIDNYFSGKAVESGHRLAASSYMFMIYFGFSTLYILAPNETYTHLLSIPIAFMLVVFMVLIINLHNTYFRVFPPHDLANIIVPPTVVCKIDKDIAEEITEEIASVVQSEGEAVAKPSMEKKIVEWSLREDKPYMKEGLTLSDAAKAMKVSTRLLSEFLNKYYDINFCSWINTLRIDEAKRILAEKPKSSLSEVATICGFSDITTFSRTFKNITKETPSAYRQRLKRGE